MTTFTIPTGARQIAVTEADQEVVSSVTQVPIVGLGVNMEANGKYHVRAQVAFQLDGGASGFKFSFVAPTGDIAVRLRVDNGETPAVVTDQYRDTGSTVNDAIAEDGYHFMTIDGIVDATAAGSFYLRFAQNVSDASAIRVLTGSYLEVTKLN